jgi:hypothetical protein
MAEKRAQQAHKGENFIRNIKKRRRTPTPPEEITSSDEVKYAEQEERVAKHVEP